MAGLVQFAWMVPKHGFQWVEEYGYRRLKFGPLQAAEFLMYVPLERETGLFRIFAQTEPTEDGVLSFANRYGWLGYDERTGAVHRRETLDAWKREIELMRVLVDTWDMVRSGDKRKLSRLIQWYDDNRCLSYKDESARITVDYLPGEWGLLDFDPKDVIVSAKRLLQANINKALGGKVSPQIMGDDLALHIVPKHLLGAMWLQFAQAVSGKKDFQQCAVCGTWFEVSPHAARKSRIYCSDSCKMKAYRERKAGGVK